MPETSVPATAIAPKPLLRNVRVVVTLASPLAVTLSASLPAAAKGEQSGPAPVSKTEALISYTLVAILLLGSLLFLFARFTRPLLRLILAPLLPKNRDRACIRCQSQDVTRIPRTRPDKLLNLLTGLKLYRYSCKKCEWTGLLKR